MSAELTTLSFPGLLAENVAAGVGGLTQETLKPGARAEIRFVPPDSGFKTHLPHAGLPIRNSRGEGYSGRSSSMRRNRRTSTLTSYWFYPSGTLTRAAGSMTISPIPSAAPARGLRTAWSSPMAHPHR